MIIMEQTLQNTINQQFIADYLAQCGSDAKYIYFTHKNTKEGYRMLKDSPIQSLVKLPNYTNGTSRD